MSNVSIYRTIKKTEIKKQQLTGNRKDNQEIEVVRTERNAQVNTKQCMDEYKEKRTSLGRTDSEQSNPKSICNRFV